MFWCRLLLLLVALASRMPVTWGGNFTIVGFFGVTAARPEDPTLCTTDVDRIKGIIFYEAFRYAIKMVNSNETYDGETYLYGQALHPYGVDTCKGNPRNLYQVQEGLNALMLQSGIGVVGPLTTKVALNMAPLAFLLDLPTVTYYVDNIDLDDRLRYPTIYRTVSSARFFIEAILDLIQTFDWKYISVVSSGGDDEGLRRATYFRKVALQRKLCISRMFILPVKPNMMQYEEAVNTIRKDDDLSVVVLFTSTFDTNEFLTKAKAMGVAPGRYTWIGDFEWNIDREINESIADMVHGSLVVGYRIRENYGFWEHLATVKATPNMYSHFIRFWEALFQCAVNPVLGIRNCTGNESLSVLRPLAEHVPVHLVMEAVFTLTCAFRHYIQELCPDRAMRSMCINYLTMRGDLLPPTTWKGVQKYLSSASHLQCPLHATSEFDMYGSGPAQYDIFNVRATNGNVTTVKVGSWTKQMNRTSSMNHSSASDYIKEYKISKESIVWANDSLTPPKSICSGRCGVSDVSYTDSSTVNPLCCFKCRACPPNSVVTNNTCVVCDSKTETANTILGICQHLPVVEIQANTVLSLIIISFAVLGVLLTTIPVVLFVLYRDSRFVKASGRELCYLMLIGLYAGFLFPLVYLVPPTNILCKIHWFISCVTFTIFYAPLVLKLNRVYRIFQSARSKIKRPPLVSPVSQIMMSFGIIGIQTLVAFSFIVNNNDILQNVLEPSMHFIVVTCRYDPFMTAINLAISLTLIAVCTFYGFKTRNFPANYNESKSIGVTMYVHCIMWAIFITAYFFTNDTDGKFTRSCLMLGFACILSYTSLLGIFGPKTGFILHRLHAGDEIDCQSTTRSAFVSPAVAGSLNVSHQTYIEVARVTCDVATETDGLTPDIVEKSTTQKSQKS